jgi:hypothetical protein
LHAISASAGTRPYSHLVPVIQRCSMPAAPVPASSSSAPGYVLLDRGRYVITRVTVDRRLIHRGGGEADSPACYDPLSGSTRTLPEGRVSHLEDPVRCGSNSFLIQTAGPDTRGCPVRAHTLAHARARARTLARAACCSVMRHCDTPMRHANVSPGSHVAWTACRQRQHVHT